MPPLVSVIMPAYNSEQYIAASIQSVLDQTYKNWELLVVDDGSTDATSTVAQAAAESDNRVRILSQENGGPGKARNNGVRNSSGTLIAFLDADDLWLPEKLEQQVQAIVAVEADLVYSSGYIFRENAALDESETFAVACGRFNGQEMLNLLLAHNFIPILSVLMRREAFDDAGPFEEAAAYQRCEDYDLWLKLAKRGSVFYGMEQSLVRYRRHSASATYKTSNVFKPMLRVIKRHIEAGTLSEAQKKKRIRTLYRELLAALLNEGEYEQAKDYMRELADWDKSGVVTSIQQLMLKVSPAGFNFISRECLYRTEWHLKKLTRKEG